MTRWLIPGALLLCSAARAESVVAARTLPAHSILTMSDVVVSATSTPGAITEAEAAVGLETRITIYAGRPVRPSDLGPPALIQRNQIVSLVFLRGNLRISAEGRALGRGSVGDRLRVMNLASRNTLSGVVTPDGQIAVDP